MKDFRELSCFSIQIWSLILSCLFLPSGCAVIPQLNPGSNGLQNGAPASSNTALPLLHYSYEENTPSSLIVAPYDPFLPRLSDLPANPSDPISAPVVNPPPFGFPGVEMKQTDLPEPGFVDWYTGTLAMLDWTKTHWITSGEHVSVAQAMKLVESDSGDNWIPKGPLKVYAVRNGVDGREVYGSVRDVVEYAVVPYGSSVGDQFAGNTTDGILVRLTPNQVVPQRQSANLFEGFAGQLQDARLSDRRSGYRPNTAALPGMSPVIWTSDPLLPLRLALALGPGYEDNSTQVALNDWRKTHSPGPGDEEIIVSNGKKLDSHRGIWISQPIKVFSRPDAESEVTHGLSEYYVVPFGTPVGSDFVGNVTNGMLIRLPSANQASPQGQSPTLSQGSPSPSNDQILFRPSDAQLGASTAELPGMAAPIPIALALYLGYGSYLGLDNSTEVARDDWNRTHGRIAPDELLVVSESTRFTDDMSRAIRNPIRVYVKPSDESGEQYTRDLVEYVVVPFGSPVGSDFVGNVTNGMLVRLPTTKVQEAPQGQGTDLSSPGFQSSGDDELTDGPADAPLYFPWLAPSSTSQNQVSQQKMMGFQKSPFLRMLGF